LIIHEYASKNILPGLRGVLAHMLAERGLSQKKIASLLEVSQPMVNRYLGRDKSVYVTSLTRLGVDAEYVYSLASAAAELLVSRRPSEDAGLLITSAVNAILLRTRPCRAGVWRHYCKEAATLWPDPLLKLVESVVESMVALEGFNALVPEVGSNIVYDPSASGSPSMMIAIDGRIVKGEGGAHVAGIIRYGGSKHSARILAAIIKRYSSKKRALLVIANNSSVRKGIEDLGWRVLSVPAHSSRTSAEEEIIESIMGSDGPVPDVVLDPGGPGLEPVAYLAAETPRDLLRLVKDLVSRL